MSELLELHRIGIISKVCGELDHHLGFSDKTLAEFIIHLAETNNDVKMFHQKLVDNGADFPANFTSNLHRIIHQMSKSSESSSNNLKGSSAMPTVPRNQTEIQFPVLSRPNHVGPVDIDELPNKEASWLKSLKLTAVDSKSNNIINNNNLQLESRKRDRDEDFSSHDNNSNRKSSINSSNNRERNNSSSEIELYQIYDGKITNILDFGCFVELEGFFRKEGLVHIAQIQQGMVRDARQVVKRGQRVKVKVISMTGTKIGLSMKEVDQDVSTALIISILRYLHYYLIRLSILCF